MTEATMSKNPAEAPVVLIVDDEKDILFILETFLSANGFSVRTAQTNAAAAEVLANEAVSVVLLDWWLGGSEGDPTSRPTLDLCHQIDPGLPVIILSGETRVDVGSESLASGADSFVPKPPNLSVLAQHISRQLARRGEKSDVFSIREKDEIIPLEELQSRYVKHVVALLDGNVSLASTKLGIHRQTVTKILAGTKLE